MDSDVLGDITAFERRLTLRETQQNLDKKLGATEFSAEFVHNFVEDALSEHLQVIDTPQPAPVVVGQKQKRQSLTEKVVFSGSLGDGNGCHLFPSIFGN